MVVPACQDITLIFVIFKGVSSCHTRGRLGIQVLYELEFAVLRIEYHILEVCQNRQDTRRPPGRGPQHTRVCEDSRPDGQRRRLPVRTFAPPVCQNRQDTRRPPGRGPQHTRVCEDSRPGGQRRRLPVLTNRNRDSRKPPPTNPAPTQTHPSPYNKGQEHNQKLKR